MIHALPGMGADERMFPLPWASLPAFAARNWKSWSNETTLAGMAETICRANSINDGDSLIGASLGGMVACEIAKIRRIEKLFLVGSAAHKNEINRVLEILHPLVKVAPIDWLRFSAGTAPHELAHMFAEADSAFIRTMCSAVFQWPGLAAMETKIYRIHGKYDLVIPPPKAPDLVLNGGHLISISHATECVGFIQSQLSK
jgi:pimeloyl-ACP methyl ester carboxylesterase